MLFAVALSRPQNGEWTDRKKKKYGIAQPLMGNGWRHCLFLLLNRNGSIVDRRLLLLRTVHHLTKMQLCNWRVSLCRRTFFGHLLSVDRASESECFRMYTQTVFGNKCQKKTHKYLLSSKTITTNQRHLYFCLIFSNAAKCCGFSGRFYLSLSMSAFALRDQRSTNNLLNCTQVFFVLLLFSFTAAQTLCSRTKRYLYWNKSHIQMHCIGAQMKASKKKKKTKWHSRKWVATSRNVANVLSVSFCIFFYIFLRRQPTITRAKTRGKLRSRALAREMQLQLSITTNTTNKINKPWFCQNCKNCSVLF